nr:MAG TPA: hypothetical protein [Bacteriophage sp.]
MNGLLSNARRAFLRPTNPRDYTHTVSRIIGAILPVTIASTIACNRTSFTTISVYSATAQWFQTGQHLFTSHMAHPA